MMAPTFGKKEWKWFDDATVHGWEHRADADLARFVLVLGLVAAALIGVAAEAHVLRGFIQAVACRVLGV